MEQLKCPSCLFVGTPELAPSKVHIGAYCTQCGAWIKWMPKEDQKFYFGKYNGELVSTCEDLGYLKWFKENCKAGLAMRNAVEHRISELQYRFK